MGASMRAKVCAASICAAMTAITACASDATAAPKKKQIESAPQTAAGTARTRTRVTVERRSFLDAGTEVLPGERKFTDYAFPPGYSPIGEALGPGKDFRRQPLLDP